MVQLLFPGRFFEVQAGRIGSFLPCHVVSETFPFLDLEVGHPRSLQLPPPPWAPDLYAQQQDDPTPPWPHERRTCAALDAWRLGVQREERIRRVLEVLGQPFRFIRFGHQREGLCLAGVPLLLEFDLHLCISGIFQRGRTEGFPSHRGGSKLQRHVSEDSVRIPRIT